MWDYTEKTMDHFRNPRNVGVIENPDGVGEVGSLACGDALRLMFKLDDKGKIKEAKFQTFGCASAIASSSALTEMIKGKTLEEAASITNQDIADFLGGLPNEKMHCSVMGRDALAAAIDNFRKGTPPQKKVEGDIVCQCFGVSRQDIEKAIRENRLSTVEEVTNFTKAGGGCGTCHPEIEKIIEEVNSRMKEEAGRQAPKKLTALQKIKLIEETLDREIRPALSKDGGGIELVDLDGDLVTVTFRGTCTSCRLSEVTLKQVVEKKLREFVSPKLTVIEQEKAEDVK